MPRRLERNLVHETAFRTTTSNESNFDPLPPRVAMRESRTARSSFTSESTSISLAKTHLAPYLSGRMSFGNQIRIHFLILYFNSNAERESGCEKRTYLLEIPANWQFAIHSTTFAKYIVQPSVLLFALPSHSFAFVRFRSLLFAWYANECEPKANCLRTRFLFNSENQPNTSSYIKK